MLNYLVHTLGPGWKKTSVWALVLGLGFMDKVIKNEELTWHTALNIVAGTL